MLGVWRRTISASVELRRLPGRARARDGRRLGSGFLVAVVVGMSLLAQACGSSSVPHLNVDISSPSPRADNSAASITSTWSGRALSVAASGDGKRVYVGTTRAGVWRSDDGGDAWQQLTWPQLGDSTSSCVDQPVSTSSQPCALPPLSVPALALSPTDPNLIFAAASHDIRTKDPRDGIYRSSDGGHSWTRVLQFQCGSVVGQPTDVLFAPDDPSRLWASGQCGVAYSEVPLVPKGGSSTAIPGVGTASTWHLVNLSGSASTLAVAPATAEGKRWVYACGPDAFYDSVDGGRTYITNSVGARCADSDGGYFYGSSSSSTNLAIVPGHPDQVYAAQANFSNGYAYFDARPLTPGLLAHPDGTRCLGTAEKNTCGGSLWFDIFDSSGAASAWTQIPSPPWYAGNGSSTFSGSVGVLTQPSGTGYLVLFWDSDSLSVSSGPPSATSWRRLDGPNASDICGAGSKTCGQGGAAMYIHPDPHAIAITRNFGLTLQPASAATNAAAAIYLNNSVVQPGSCAGTIFEVTDGGVYHSATCGKDWSQAHDLMTLGASMIGGLPQPGSNYPALYFNTFDNADWASLDRGLTWHTFPANCGDCDAVWTDPLESDVMVQYSNQPDIVVYKGPAGTAPDPNYSDNPACSAPPAKPNTCTVKIPFPPTGGPYLRAVADWTRGVGAYRMLVLTEPGERPKPYGDFVMVAPKSANNPVDGQGNADLTKPTPMVVWRYQGPSAGTVGAWQPVGPDVPRGAVVLQASGGHQNPVYYVADRVIRNGNLYDEFAQGNHLFRSHETGGAIDGWDCIVPGPQDPTKHDGQCASSTHSDATHAGQAWTFQSDPYDPQVVYVEDTDGIKVSTDGGSTWRADTLLTSWLTGHGEIGPTCVGDFCNSEPIIKELAHMEFVPGEPGTRFAVGEEGVFFTTDANGPPVLGAHWHRLLSTAALACMPNWTFFDPAPHSQRTLYVACTGRSILSFVGIPRPSDTNQQVNVVYKPSKLVTNGIPTFSPNSSQSQRGTRLSPAPTPVGTPQVSIVSPANDTHVPGGSPVTLAARSFDPETGGSLPDANLVWTIGDTVLGTGASVRTTLGAPGSYTIALIGHTQDGLFASAAVTIIVDPPAGAPSVAILAPTDGAWYYDVVPPGQSVHLEASGSANVVRFDWSDSIQSDLGSGQSLDVVLQLTSTTNCASTDHIIRLTGTTADGQTATASVTVTLRATCIR